MTADPNSITRFRTIAQHASVMIVFLAVIMHAIGRVEQSPPLWYIGYVLFIVGLFAVGVSFRIPLLCGIVAFVVAMLSASYVIQVLSEAGPLLTFALR